MPQPWQAIAQRFCSIRIVGAVYENTLFNRWNDGSWQNNSKPTVKRDLNNSVFLDGDWCWDASPFQVTDETKAMVIRNICFLLNSFIHCSAYENVIFCWVMHEQSIIDSIINELDTENCIVKKISLTVDEINLQNRLKADVARKIRTTDIIDRSIAEIPMYQALDTIKIETSNKTIREIVDKIMAI